MTTLEEPPVLAISAASEARPLTPRRRKRNLRTWVQGGGLSTLVFLLPMLFVFIIFSWSPIVQSMVMSLQKTNLIETSWVGLQNFEHVFADPRLPKAVLNTLYFAGLALLFGFPIPILLAVLMSEVRRGKGLYSALAYLPVVVPPVVAVLLWKVFYNADATGPFNTVLSWVGIAPQPWLQSAATAMPSLVLEATWAGAGGTIIIYLAALTSVNPDLYDAAEIDGANIWKKVRHVTLPQLRSVLLVTFILQIIGTAQVFLEPFLFTNGGPANSTSTVLLLIYRYAFQNSLGGNYGAATALSVLLAVFLAAFSLVYFRLTRSWSTE